MFRKKAEERKEKLKIIEIKNKQEGQNRNRKKTKTISPTDSRDGVFKISTLANTPASPSLRRPRQQDCLEFEPAWSTHIKWREKTGATELSSLTSACAP